MADLDEDSRQDADTSLRNDKPATHHHRSPSAAENRSKQKFVVYGGALLVWYNAMVQVLRYKYAGKKVTPFDTQSFMIRTSILTFVVSGLTLPLLIQDYLAKPGNRPFSPVLYMIIKSVFSVTVVLANITLMLILLIE
ncbi:hypothetical protein QVD17_36337 [Tagetes erecta]|uniref:Uncharacterized protein n=1 Tax=Tagetes erecta TaxID=13708 RepID=A0AAD8JTZ0_TARER|nr:hypothetical protein QVD17_36337 [Tagetes erecta]